MSLDHEMAEAFMQRPDWDEEPENRPMMSDDSVINMALRDLGNQLRMLRMEHIKAAGGNPNGIKMLEGPRTAFEAAAAKGRMREHYALTARLLPHKAEEMQAKLAALDK